MWSTFSVKSMGMRSSFLARCFASSMMRFSFCSFCFKFSRRIFLLVWLANEAMPCAMR